MPIVLDIAAITDAQEIYDLQIKSFKVLLEKHQDYDSSPGAEKLECIIQRLREPITNYYFISLEEKHIGASRICHFDKRSNLKQLFIFPEYQGYGYVQEAIVIAKSLYPVAEKWELDTILQEEKLCYLYEKMGYRKTGKVKHIKNGMDLVFYAKWANNS